MHKYLQKTNSNFQTLISPWSRPRWATLFWAFFPGMAYIFILQKIVAQRDRLHLFCTFPAILVKYSAPTSSNFFLCKIWTMTNSKSAANITWWVWWMRNRGLLLTFFGPFLTPLDALTHSALVMIWMICVFTSCKGLCKIWVYVQSVCLQCKKSLEKNLKWK